MEVVAEGVCAILTSIFEGNLTHHHHQTCIIHCPQLHSKVLQFFMLTMYVSLALVGRISEEGVKGLKIDQGHRTKTSHSGLSSITITYFSTVLLQEFESAELV